MSSTARDKQSITDLINHLVETADELLKAADLLASINDTDRPRSILDEILGKIQPNSVYTYTNIPMGTLTFTTDSTCSTVLSNKYEYR